MYANKPSVLGLLDKLRVERGSHDSHIYMVHSTPLVKISFDNFMDKDVNCFISAQNALEI